MKSLKVKTKTTGKKFVFVVIAAGLLVALGGTAFALQKTVFSNRPEDSTPQETALAEDNGYQNSVDYDPPTEEEKTAQQEQKEEIVNPPQQPPTETLSVSIIRAGQSARGQPVNIRTLINGANTGTCKVSLTRHSHAVNKQFPIVFEATSASCQAADIAASEFPEPGEWQLTVTAESPNFNPGTATAAVTIEK